MIRLGSFDLAGHVVSIRASAPLAGHLAAALGDLACSGRRRGPTLTVERFGTGHWSVSWRREQRYEGPDEDVAFYDTFGALNEVTARAVGGRGDVAVHGGSVSVAGRAVAVVGPSGAGKSTLTAALVQAGHGYIADELTVIAVADDTAGESMVRSYHRPIGLRTGGADLIGVEIPAGPFEYTFPLRASTIGSLATSAPLGMICFIERDPLQPPAATSLSAAAALHRLSNQTLGAWGLERPTFRRLEMLVRSVPAITIRYDDIADGVGLIEQNLPAR